VLVTLTCICDRELEIDGSNEAACQRGILDAIEAGWKRVAGRSGTLDVFGEHESPMSIEAIVSAAVEARMSGQIDLHWRCPRHVTTCP
jgi:hypothetical protein